jgi:hypothetical protein
MRPPSLVLIGGVHRATRSRRSPLSAARHVVQVHDPSLSKVGTNAKMARRSRRADEFPAFTVARCGMSQNAAPVGPRV